MSEPVDAKEMVRHVVAEIAELHYAADIEAIAVVVVRRSGDIRTLQAYSEGTKFPLIAGTAILHANTLNLAAVPKQDGGAPSPEA